MPPGPSVSLLSHVPVVVADGAGAVDDRRAERPTGVSRTIASTRSEEPTWWAVRPLLPSLLKPHSLRAGQRLTYTWAPARYPWRVTMDEFFTKMYVVMQCGLLDLRKRAESERGATAVEYGLLVALIAGVIVVAVAALGVKVNAAFTGVTAKLP
jgi:pilus assembly protein Flp/PilA